MFQNRCVGALLTSPLIKPLLELNEWARVMKACFLIVQRFLAAEDGPTAVEYAVMLSLIIVVCLAAITTIGSNSSSVFQNTANSIH